MFHIKQQVRSNKFGEGYVSEISHREDGFVITCIFSAENAQGTIVYYNEDGKSPEDYICEL